MYGYIYLIVNNINGKTYVGKHKLYKKAWNNDNYMGSGKRLKLAQKKYGIENFEKFLITWTYSEEDACEKEKFWIAEYRRSGKAEYNIADGGNGGVTGDVWNKGIPCSEEHRKKISEANKGRKCSDETRKKLSESHKGMSTWNKGLKTGPISEETKKKISEANKGNVPWTKGKKLSEETRKKIAASHKGMSLSEDSKKKISESKKGKHWYNNGVIQIQSFECPDGFVPGRDKIKLEK